jgi:hypothetical protein
VLPDHAGLATALLYPGATRPLENKKLFVSLGSRTALRLNPFRRFALMKLIEATDGGFLGGIR